MSMLALGTGQTNIINVRFPQSKEKKTLAFWLFYPPAWLTLAKSFCHLRAKYRPPAADPALYNSPSEYLQQPSGATYSVLNQQPRDDARDKSS